MCGHFGCLLASLFAWELIDEGVLADPPGALKYLGGLRWILQLVTRSVAASCISPCL